MMNSALPIPPPQRRIALPIVRPRLTWVLLGVNVLMFAVETLMGGSDNGATLVMLGAKVNALIVMGQYWRLVTPMFLHIGIVHILVNGYALFVIGPEVEALYGYSRFLTLYLLSGVAGNVMSYAFTSGLSAGASTALFGLIGAQLVFYYRQRDKLGSFGQQRLMNIVGIIVINVLFGMSNSGVDNFGHLGGLVGGALLGWLLCPVYEIEYGWEGQALVQDRNSLWRGLPGVLLFVMLLVVATGAVTFRQAHLPQVKLEQGIEALKGDDYAAALPLLEQAARDLPDDARAHYALAADYFFLKRYADAVSSYEHVLQLTDQLPDAHYYLALSHLQLGQRQEGVAHLQQYLALDPNGQDADQARALVAQLGD
jgi:rhomboid protease GluP